jgi:hypothetical protein
MQNSRVSAVLLYFLSDFPTSEINYTDLEFRDKAPRKTFAATVANLAMERTCDNLEYGDSSPLSDLLDQLPPPSQSGDQSPHSKVETKGLEPSTPALQRLCSPN